MKMSNLIRKSATLMHSVEVKNGNAYPNRVTIRIGRTDHQKDKHHVLVMSSDEAAILAQQLATLAEEAKNLNAAWSRKNG